MRFAECLQSIRKSEKVTQLQLAEIIGVDRTTVAKYETGAREPDLETLCKLAEALNVSTDELLGRFNY